MSSIKSSRSSWLACARVTLACAVWLLAGSVSANGRMPGANDLTFSTGDPARLVARATFGIVESADHGATWSWICEQAIDVSGVIADPPLTLTADGSLVLLPPTGSALVSADRGCNWARAGEPLAGSRGADLTTDPSDTARVLVVTSTLRSVDDAGLGVYDNRLVETRDNGRSWQLLATLGDDFEAETVELATSDPRRIYISGSDAQDPRLGVMLRSEDGGHTWSKSTLPLPAGTGSLWISAIHPRDPDRLWLRVSARGDTLGLLPGRLYLSADKGATFSQLAATTKGMFGFALSPDGESLAYGGPRDGLFVGPSDGSAFVKRNNLGVRCLRWLEADSLYVCASEPDDAFSVGVSSDQGVSFRPLYKLVDTCPAACADNTSFADTCQAAWTQTRPFIAASGAECSADVAWSAPPPSTPPPTPMDAGVAIADAGRAEAKRTSSGCSLHAAPRAGDPARGLWLYVIALGWLCRRRLRSGVLGVWLVASAACSDSGTPASHEHGSELEDDEFMGCPDSIPRFELGMRAVGEQNQLAAEVVAASNVPPLRYLNDWTVALTHADGSAVQDIVVTKARPFMPVHGHDGIVQPTLKPLTDPEQVEILGMNFNMRGPWEIQLWLSSESAGDDYAVFHICVEE